MSTDTGALGLDRWTSRRAEYLKATTILSHREGLAVAYSERGFSDAGIAKQIDRTAGTVRNYLDRAVAYAGPAARYPRPEPEIKRDLERVELEDLADWTQTRREVWEGAANQHPEYAPDLAEEANRQAFPELYDDETDNVATGGEPMSQPDDVPPGARCTQPGCDRPATDPVEPAGLCPEHHPTHETDTETEDEPPRHNCDEPTAAGEQYPDHPGTGNLEPLETATFSGTVRHTDTLKARNWWVNWVKSRPPEDPDDEDAPVNKKVVAPYLHNGRVFPCRWRSGLTDEEHPATEFAEPNRWAGWPTRAFATVDGIVSNELGLGIIIPTNQDLAADLAATPDADKPVTLLDWDDVRDPETEEIHPAAGWALAACDCYAEISQSGEGIHQFVYGSLPGGLKKFIRYLDDEPFVGDDRPQLEIYASGRLTAMTGRHVAGTGTDLVDGQDLLDRLTYVYGTAGNAGSGTPSDPHADSREGTDTGAGGGATAGGESGRYQDATPDREQIADALERGEYEGPPLSSLKETQPDNRPLDYHAVVEAFYRGAGEGGGYADVLNWKLEGYAAALGARDGLKPADVKADLAGGYLDETPVEQVTTHETPRRVENGYRRARSETANFGAPSWGTLAQRGILPPAALEDRRTRLVALPDPDELRPSGPTETPEIPDDSTLPGYGDLSPRDAQEQTQAALARAIGRQDDVLIEALPTMGKTYAAGRAPTLVDGETPVTVVTQRGRNEQYAELCEHAAAAGLDLGTAPGEPDGDVYVLPSFKRDCPTANGDHGEDWADLVTGWYDAGATPRKIHAHGGREAGDEDDNLPCQRDGCEYARLWDFDPDEFELLIGHPVHLSKPKVASDRTVIIDEYPGGAFETTLSGPHLRGAITRYLREFDGLPFDSFGELAMGRTDTDRRADALAWLEDRGVEPDDLGAIRFDDSHKHALAPLAVYTMLATADSGTLGNGFARAELPDGGVGVFEYDHGPDDEPAVHILRRPDPLRFASNVIGLDGTPSPYLWEVATGCEFTHRVVLEARRVEYVEHALGYRIVQTSEYSRPYHNLDHINTARDGALLRAIRHRHGEPPGVITSSAALIEWDRDDLIDLEKRPDRWAVTDGPVDEPMRYGNLLGSNQFDTTRVGAVIGSSHYGDGYIGKWAAYAGEAATLGTDARGQDEQGRMTRLEYGETGDRIHEHMKTETLQAMFRFGRDGNGATVYVDSDVLPDWVSVHGHGEVATTCDGLRGTIEALEDLETATTAEIEDHEAVEIKGCQIRRHIDRLRETGAVKTGPDPEDGRRDVHTLTDTAGITPDGVVTLPDVGTETGAESCGTLPYSSTKGNSTSKSDPPDTPDEPATATAEDSGERGSTEADTERPREAFATLAGDEPTEDALAALAEDDVENGVLDCPKNAWTDGGTDWSLSGRVVGMPDAGDGGG
jgi:hypothetical protein